MGNPNAKIGDQTFVKRKYPYAFYSNCMKKVISHNGIGSTVLGENWPDAASKLRAEEGIGEAKPDNSEEEGFRQIMIQSDEGKPTESAQQDEQRYERIMTVARHVQLSEDQVKRLLGCFLMIGLELTEVDPVAAPSTPVSAPRDADGIGWCSSCDLVHEVERPKCPKCGDWLIFAADDKPQSSYCEGIDTAITFLGEWNKRGDFIQTAGFFAAKLAALKDIDAKSVGQEETKK